MRRNAHTDPESEDASGREDRRGRSRAAVAPCLCLVVLIAGIAPGPPGDTVPAAMVETTDPPCNATVVERTSWLMGTSLTARVCASSRDAGIAGIERAFSRVRRLEGRLSTWRTDSELSRLNNARPGQWVPLSSTTASLMAEVRDWVGATDGAFDPAVGAAIDAWDMRGRGRIPAEAELEAARGAVGPSAWELSSGAGDARSGPRIRRDEGVRLDAGAFGKGAALRAASDELRTSSIRWALLDFGGQLTLWSRDPDARWAIGVADPRHRDRPIARLQVAAASIATTGTSERAIEVDGRWFGHVIDPRSAAPVPRWGSVTVFADDPLAADVLSTALFVLGPEDARSWSPAGTSDSPGVLVVESTPHGPKLFANDRLGAFASIDAIVPTDTTHTKIL